MRQVDPNIKIMMESYSYGPDLLPAMLKIAGKSIDIVITRSSETPQIRQLLDVIRAYNRESGARLVLANTEWLAMRDDAPEPFSDPEIPQRALPTPPGYGTDYRKARSFRQIHWFYALNAARLLMGYLSVGGELCSTNFNNCVNTWGQNIIEASKEGAWLSPAGKVYEFLADLDARFPLETGYRPAEGVFLSAQACETSGGGISILLLNRGAKEVRTELQLPASYSVKSVETLYAPDRLSRTRLGASDIQVETGKADGPALLLRPLSLSKVRAARA